ncbi:hypothetical protein [Ralstonia phage phiITL-1]|uniref:Uncharacterized protein n=1 Tax=Ralstonia phage phiITL-1 TaxID=1597967 RepID=A0A0U1ZDV1_9CAUD|nr:hypothetical protein HOR02_gp31 [Ralstonia phage phiITL-1]AJT60815.1 hypothetical protein [Ralstonia phage phiITL-1]
MQSNIAQAHALNTPEANLMHRMAHIQRMEEMVHALTEEGTQARADLEAHVEALRREIHAVYRAEKQDQLRVQRAYAKPARVTPLPEDNGLPTLNGYQPTHEDTTMAVSGDLQAYVHEGKLGLHPHASWEGRLPEMEDGYKVPFAHSPIDGSPLVPVGLLARAWAAVKGVFQRAAH